MRKEDEEEDYLDDSESGLLCDFITTRWCQIPSLFALLFFLIQGFMQMHKSYVYFFLMTNNV